MDLHLNEPGSLAWLQFLQVTVLIAAVGLLAGLVCRRRPHLAYVLWILVLLKCLTPPLWSSPAGIFSWAQARFTRPASLTGNPDSRTWAALPQEEITKPGENLLRLPRTGSRTGATPSLPDWGDSVSAHDNPASVIDKPDVSWRFSVSWTARSGRWCVSHTLHKLWCVSRTLYPKYAGYNVYAACLIVGGKEFCGTDSGNAGAAAFRLPRMTSTKAVNSQAVVPNPNRPTRPA